MTPSDGRAAARGGPLIEALDPALLRDPIEYLVADHYRQRAVLNLVDTLARGRTTPAIRRRIAIEVTTFMRVDLARHVADEEQDVFPLLRRRVAEGDDAIGILEQLRLEHEADERAGRGLVEGLALAVERPNAELPVGLKVVAHGFVEGQRRHLAWENAIIIPILRRCLTAADVVELARRMARRRGISLGPARRTAAGARVS